MWQPRLAFCIYTPDPKGAEPAWSLSRVWGLGISNLGTWGRPAECFVHSPPGAEGECDTDEEAAVSHIPFCICHWEHLYCCFTPDSNIHPLPWSWFCWCLGCLCLLGLNQKISQEFLREACYCCILPARSLFWLLLVLLYAKYFYIVSLRGVMAICPRTSDNKGSWVSTPEAFQGLVMGLGWALGQIQATPDSGKGDMWPHCLFFLLHVPSASPDVLMSHPWLVTRMKNSHSHICSSWCM